MLFNNDEKDLIYWFIMKYDYKITILSSLFSKDILT